MSKGLERAPDIYGVCYNAIVKEGFKIRDRTILFLGIVLIVAGAILWTYIGFKIQELEQSLRDGNLNLEDSWYSEGSLLWWRGVSRTILYPIVLSLLVMGLAFVLLTLFGLHVLSGLEG
jgi:hypothetical protein